MRKKDRHLMALALLAGYPAAAVPATGHQRPEGRPQHRRQSPPPVRETQDLGKDLNLLDRKKLAAAQTKREKKNAKRAAALKKGAFNQTAEPIKITKEDLEDRQHEIHHSDGWTEVGEVES